MQISERLVGEVTILDLKGRLVLDDGHDVFRDTIAGLGVMVSKFVTLHNRDGQLKLCKVHGRSFRVLNVTRLLTVFIYIALEPGARVLQGW